MANEQPESTAQTNVDLITQAIADFFRDPEDVCAVQPVGTAERTHNLQAVADSQIKCERALRDTPLPKIDVGKLEEVSGSITLTVTGDYGAVLIQVTDSPLARYAKKHGDELVRGEAVVDSPKLWARLARWAASGNKKFVG